MQVMLITYLKNNIGISVELVKQVDDLHLISLFPS